MWSLLCRALVPYQCKNPKLCTMYLSGCLQEVGLTVALQRLLALVAAAEPADGGAQPDIREELTDLAAHLSRQVNLHDYIA